MHRIVSLIVFVLIALPGATLAQPPLRYEPDDTTPTDAPGLGTHVVLVSGDEEYRSEEALPQLAAILSKRHGFTCTVLFAIDPETGTANPDARRTVPGLAARGRHIGLDPQVAPLGKIFHCGDVGAGQITKLANNALTISTYSLLLEIRDLVEQSGLDVPSFMDTLNQSTGRSFVTQNFPLRPGRLQMRGMPAKDVGTCLEVAATLGLEMPMVQQCFNAGHAAARR